MKTERKREGALIPVCMTGIKESRENGQHPSQFVADMLKHALGLEKAPTIEWSHRTLEQANSGQPATSIICGEAPLLFGKGPNVKAGCGTEDQYDS